MARAAAAAEAWDKAAEHARRAGDEDERSEILSWVASSMFFGPTPVPEGIRRCEEIRAEVVGNPGSEAWALRSLAGLHAMEGRFELARTLLAEANAIFEELGQTRYSSALDIDGIVELLAGDLDAAEGRLRAGYLALEKMGDRAFRPTTAAHLAEALYAQGRDEDAGPLTEISEQLAARDDLLTQVVWRRVRAKVIAGQGRIDEAERPCAGGGERSASRPTSSTPAPTLSSISPTSSGERAASTRHAQLSRRASLSTRRRATAWPSSRREPT